MAGPIGRRGRWHQFFSTFDIEVIYVKGEDQQVPDILSCWSYPAHEAAPDVSIHGTEEDLAGWERDELEEKEWADSELQFSRRVGRFVDVLGVGKSARSRGLKRKARALCSEFHRQGWSPTAMAESIVHTPDAFLFPDLSVSSLRTGKATDRAVPRLAADVQILFDDWTEFYRADPHLAVNLLRFSQAWQFGGSTSFSM